MPSRIFGIMSVIYMWRKNEIHRSPAIYENLTAGILERGKTIRYDSEMYHRAFQNRLHVQRINQQKLQCGPLAVINGDITPKK